MTSQGASFLNTGHPAVDDRSSVAEELNAIFLRCTIDLLQYSLSSARLLFALHNVVLLYVLK